MHLNESLSLVPLPGEGTALVGELRQRNELMVTLVGATNLTVKDKAMLYGEGSTDPVVTLKVLRPVRRGRRASMELVGRAQSSVAKKTLEPIWRVGVTLTLVWP